MCSDVESSTGDDKVRLDAVVQSGGGAIVSYSGGAIYSYSGSLIVSNSTFANTAASSVTLTSTPDNGSTDDIVSLECAGGRQHVCRGWRLSR